MRNTQTVERVRQKGVIKMSASKTFPANPNTQWRSGRYQNWCEEFSSDRVLKSNTWVKLHKPIDVFCDDEALLLCQESDLEWIAWIPDYGEAVLHVSQIKQSKTSI
jgi:hypothetical protein